MPLKPFELARLSLVRLVAHSKLDLHINHCVRQYRLTRKTIFYLKTKFVAYKFHFINFGISQPRPWKHCHDLKINPSPEPGLGSATASLLITVSINGCYLYLTIFINGYQILGGDKALSPSSACNCYS
jgi:hypothetical protein